VQQVSPVFLRHRRSHHTAAPATAAAWCFFPARSGPSSSSSATRSSCARLPTPNARAPPAGVRLGDGKGVEGVRGLMGTADVLLSLLACLCSCRSVSTCSSDGNALGVLVVCSRGWRHVDRPKRACLNGVRAHRLGATRRMAFARAPRRPAPATGSSACGHRGRASHAVSHAHATPGPRACSCAWHLASTTPPATAPLAAIRGHAWAVGARHVKHVGAVLRSHAASRSG
jgi:hypothetical protein